MGTNTDTARSISVSISTSIHLRVRVCARVCLYPNLDRSLARCGLVPFYDDEGDDKKSRSSKLVLYLTQYGKLSVSWYLYLPERERT